MNSMILMMIGGTGFRNVSISSRYFFVSKHGLVLKLSIISQAEYNGFTNA